MDDLSDLGLQGPEKVICLEDFYNVETDFELSGNKSRPPSTMSFSSWTFSPISEDPNSGQEGGLNYTDNNGISVCNQQPVPSDDYPYGASGHEESNQALGKVYMPVLQGNQPVQPEQTMSSWDYNMYPGAVTYHQSVNIHNCMSSFYMGQPVWTQEYGYMVPPGACNYNTSQISNQSRLSLEEQSNLQTAIDHSSQDPSRCSTPDYLVALNAIGQTPRHRQMSEVNFSFNDSMGQRLGLIHDSGYSSDIGASPIIQLQDGNIKLTNHKLTSTPQPPPVMRLTSIEAALNKENTPPTIQPFSSLAACNKNTAHTPQHYSSLAALNKNSTPSPQQYSSIAALNKYSEPHFIAPFYPTINMGTTSGGGKNICANDIKIQQDVCFSQSVSVSEKSQYKVFSEHKTSEYSEHKPIGEYSSMAEYQQSKKAKAVAKRKPKSVSSDNSMRRHNEPLSQKSLDVMNKWYLENKENPYPSKAQKDMLAKDGGLTIAQVKSWFANKRNRSNNTRPKKQKQQMESRLMEICHQLAQDARKPDKDNAYYIQQLSSILHH